MISPRCSSPWEYTIPECLPILVVSFNQIVFSLFLHWLDAYLRDLHLVLSLEGRKRPQKQVKTHTGSHRLDPLSTPDCYNCNGTSISSDSWSIAVPSPRTFKGDGFWVIGERFPCVWLTYLYSGLSYLIIKKLKLATIFFFINMHRFIFLTFLW